eukprot:g31482.t1
MPLLPAEFKACPHKGKASQHPAAAVSQVLGSSEDILASSARLRASFFKHLVSKFSQDVPSLWCPAGPQDHEQRVAS